MGNPRRKAGGSDLAAGARVTAFLGRRDMML
jgi:hypothetical protein